MFLALTFYTFYTFNLYSLYSLRVARIICWAYRLSEINFYVYYDYYLKTDILYWRTDMLHNNNIIQTSWTGMRWLG